MADIAPTAPPAQATAEHWTYERYLRETVEGEYFAIIEGEKVMSPSPTFNHQNIIGNLYVQFQSWLRSQKAGRVVFAPFDVVFDDTHHGVPEYWIVSPKSAR